MRRRSVTWGGGPGSTSQASSAASAHARIGEGNNTETWCVACELCWSEVRAGRFQGSRHVCVTYTYRVTCCVCAHIKCDVVTTWPVDQHRDALYDARQLNQGSSDTGHEADPRPFLALLKLPIRRVSTAQNNAIGTSRAKQQ